MVRQDDEAARQYIERELQARISDPFIGLVVTHNDKQIGAVILNDYTPGRNIEITVAGDGPWSIKDVREIARYCFERVQRITARTDTRNTRSAYVLGILGFKREGLMREFFTDGDAVVFGLLKSEQRIVKL